MLVDGVWRVEPPTARPITVPVLWDKHRRTIVKIVVYRGRFATAQSAYEQALVG